MFDKQGRLTRIGYLVCAINMLTGILGFALAYLVTFEGW